MGARERGFCVLSASPAEVEAEPSFASLGDLLDGELEGILPQLPKPQRRALGTALLLGEPVGPPPDEPAISVALLSTVRALADEAPLLLAIDDLQWIDFPSATALSFVARRLTVEPVGLLLCFRQAARATPSGFDRVLSEERVRRISLGPLSAGAIARLLRLRLETTFARPTLHRLHELSAGAPFFALELGRALRAGTLRLELRERLPLTLESSMSDRLAALPPATQEALAAAGAASKPTLTFANGKSRRRPSVKRLIPLPEGSWRATVHCGPRAVGTGYHVGTINLSIFRRHPSGASAPGSACKSG